MKHTILVGTMVAGISGAMLLTGCGGGEKQPGAGGAAAPAEKSAAKIKIGFLVKQPEEPWFQYEWKFADKAGKDLGFEVIKQGIPDGDKTLAAIDNLAAGGAKGFVICAPDVRLGPGVAARAKAGNLKFMCVDDALVGADGKKMDIPYMGMSARKIGNQVGDVLLAEMKKRGWKIEEVAAMAVTYDELDTIRERTEGAMETLKAGGFPADRIFKTATQKLEIPSTMETANAMLTQKADIKKWLVFGGNDASVLGAIRATEQHQLAPENVIGVGINGTDCQSEFAKEKATGFYASILPEVWREGYETAAMIFKWAKEGVAPPAETYTVGVMINRENYKQVLKEKGIMD